MLSVPNLEKRFQKRPLEADACITVIQRSATRWRCVTTAAAQQTLLISPKLEENINVFTTNSSSKPQTRDPAEGREPEAG